MYKIYFKYYTKKNSFELGRSFFVKLLRNSTELIELNWFRLLLPKFQLLCLHLLQHRGETVDLTAITDIGLAKFLEDHRKANA